MHIILDHISTLDPTLDKLSILHLSIAAKTSTSSWSGGGRAESEAAEDSSAPDGS